MNALGRLAVPGQNSYFTPSFQNPPLDYLPIEYQGSLKVCKGKGKWFEVVDGHK